MSATLEDLAAMVATLRDPERGCDWALRQSFATIAPYTIEEAYEVVDRIEAGDMGGLKDELGDLALQVVFHAQIAADAGHFALGDVIDAICAKIVRRRPHILGDAPASPGWEAVKAAERSAKGDDASALAGVAMALPALVRAQKLQKRAGSVGFDWPDAAGPRSKVIEEIAELDAAADDKARAEEFGDLLFAAVNWARHLGIDAEAALRAANAKFERRFRAMEALEAGFSGLSLDEQEALWGRVKQAEAAVGSRSTSS